MTKIKKLTEEMLEELDGAKGYAECYVEKKANDETTWANRFKEMANDELKHAMYLHDYVVQQIDKLSKVYTPPKEMMDKWEKDHAEYVERAAWIKQMLTL